jgi:hypothetical protein
VWYGAYFDSPMSKILFCLAIYILIVSSINGQTYFSKLLDKPYPFIGVVWGSIETPDSGFILMHTSFDIFQDTNKINIVKINKIGNVVWEKSYGLEGTAHEQYEIIRTKDSCYVFCGAEQKDLIYSSMLFKINEQGDSIWMKTYNSGFYLGYFGKVIETSNADLISIGGYDKTPPDGSDPWRQIYIVKTDKDGNMLWQKNYGSQELNDNGRDIVETLDKGFICSGYVGYPYLTNDYFVQGIAMKIDSLGNLKWTKNYYSPEYNQAFIEINKTLDGNYLLSGESSNNRYVLTSDPNGTGGILLKIDKDGNTIWFKRYNDEISDTGCYDFVELPDSSFVTVGFNHQPTEKSSIIKFNSQGEIIWMQSYLLNTAFESSEALYKILPTKDNGFLLSGYGFSPDLSNPVAIAKGWYLKVDSLGCPMPLCVSAIEEPNEPESTKEQNFQISSNPTSGAFEVQWTKSEGTGLLEVYNLSGLLLLREKVYLQNGFMQLSLEGQVAGVYLVRLRSAERSLVSKVVLE